MAKTMEAGPVQFVREVASHRLGFDDARLVASALEFAGSGDTVRAVAELAFLRGSRLGTTRDSATRIADAMGLGDAYAAAVAVAEGTAAGAAHDWEHDLRRVTWACRACGFVHRAQTDDETCPADVIRQALQEKEQR